MANILECPQCGAPLEDINPGVPTIKCKFCHSIVLKPAELSKIVPTDMRDPSAAKILQRSQDLKRMVELARSGKQIEAIRIYREVFDTSLAESKRAIDATAAGQPLVIPEQMKMISTTPSQTELLHKIARMHRDVSPLEAIKLFKDAYGSSLRDSKDLVEKMAAGELVTLPDGTTFQLTQGFTDLTTNGSQMNNNTNDGSSRLVKIVAISGLAIGILAVIIGAIIGIGNEKRPKALIAPLSTDTPVPTATIIPFASPILTFGGEGTGPGLFSDAREIGVDQKGNIYVGDFETGIVQAFDANGSYINQWFTGQRDDGNDMYLRDMAVTLDGRVFIPSWDGIYEFVGLSGQRLGKLTYPDEGYFEDVAAAPDGSLVAVLFYAGENIVRFDNTGEVDLFIESPIGNVTDHSELDTQIALDGLGNIYLLGSFNNLALIYNREGRYQNKFGGDGEGPGTFRAVGAIAVDNHSRIYISDFSGIQIFDSNGRYLDSFDNQSGIREMCFDLNGNLYIVDVNQVVTKYHINK